MIFILVIVSIVILSELILLGSVLLLKDELFASEKEEFVSVLISARDEERFIGGVIQSLLNQDYNYDKFEILIGDDNSSDSTASVVKSFADKNKNVHCFPIKAEDKRTGGKAGVLDILIEKTQGEHILIADADMVYPRSWIRAMSAHLAQGQLVSAFTKVRGKGIWNQWQNLDWLLNLSGVKMLSKFGFDLTAIGNNMGFSKSSYRRIPGFGKMKGFLTEDMDLLLQMKSVSVPAKFIFSKQTLGSTQPSENLTALIAQRKRWMSGAFKAPIWLIAGWFLRVILFPTVLVLCVFHLEAGFLIFLIHMVLQCGVLLLLKDKLDIKISVIALITFDLFYLFLNLVSLTGFLGRKKISWKGRLYSKNELMHTEV
jgi:cellulose synthase/poly-beta-1,6-N-acetylglucosamine synthase-like glycosyltransferase